jgi:ubiquinone/menaquinone biosynthesis C-methylase UbiE
MIMENKDKDVLKKYEGIYSDSQSFRLDWEGDISIKYKLPKYINTFITEVVDKERALSILEVGSGDGEITNEILKRCEGKEILYFTSEVTSSGAKNIKQRGIRVFQTSAMQISAVNGCVDTCISFDVMHHVKNPERMAEEMMRVTNRSVFLIESNRLSLGRVLLENTEKYKSVGEYSYYPWEYKRFFLNAGARKVIIKPFLFIMPKMTGPLMPLAIFTSELLERIPLLRWQCSGVMIKAFK